MLSKALQKANTAVLLDNAANFEGAMEAYNDACQLLHLVMLRSDGGEDEKQKLQEIRDTYMVRVTELQRMDFSFRDLDSKALPERPLSQESYGDLSHPIIDENEELAREKRASLQRSSMVRPFDLAEGLASNWDHPPRQSLLPSPLGDRTPATAQSYDSISRHYPGSSRRISKFEYMDASESSEVTTSGVDISHAAGQSDLSSLAGHKKEVNESTSWLDTIDESGASSPASMRSEVSSIYLRHRGNFHHTVGTEAEFDAALDAAVEAAYDEGLEPAVDIDDNRSSNDIVANARRNIEMAKQKVREAEREAQIALTRGQETQRLQEQPAFDGVNDLRTGYLDEEAEEEERLLEEMTRGYVMDDFEFGIQSKSALPRQSRSGSLSGRMRDGPTTSNTMTALTPLTEDASLPFIDNKGFEPSASPPSHGALSVSTNSGHASTSTPTVRARRLSALLKLAKVDTYDADAVLEEMQSLESVLDQVQMSLSKKIGSEVGVQGAMPLFKSAQVLEDSATVDAPPSKPSNVPSKSYLTSWRKLRSKNSGVSATASLPASKDTNKDNATVNTIPMTSLPTSQPLRRRVSQLQYNGSNNYMGALARLCDAAQVLDQIAQQVEDPGLRHSSPTLVGLELSTRHAAEFFGLYVCRFALNDIGMMLDKFIKRGSEWVLI
ncbi:hypothetical protein CBS63078_7328 [Aspergillus niger]|nr:hypothetical protein CBS115989_804 [Aspergillus niger]KAI2838442.1 hypothetical protein CBS11232_9607 [Aspergillus niger]KAI2842684.1 hypothetical protein CBS11350_5652 [Aspergillus niger]KAI2847770.1 hypothetical protein CBS12448_9240 [Aspergillus niger]KAI2868755.1 hypothetical protein CBS115988_10481 [Aspergillus niger]